MGCRDRECGYAHDDGQDCFDVLALTVDAHVHRRIQGGQGLDDPPDEQEHSYAHDSDHQFLLRCLCALLVFLDILRSRFSRYL